MVRGVGAGGVLFRERNFDPCGSRLEKSSRVRASAQGPQTRIYFKAT